MRILLINKYHFLKGGAERAYFDMARMLESQGHEVAFFSMEHPKNESTQWKKYFIQNIEYHDISISFIQKLALIGKILFNFEAKKKLEKLLDDFYPDIVHVHNIYHQLSPSIFWPLRKRGIPIVMTLHDYKLISPNYSLFVRGKIWEHASGLRCIVDRCVQNSLSKSIVCAVEKWLHALLGSYEKVDLFVSPSHFLIEKFREFGFKREIVFLPNPLMPRKETIEKIIRERDTLLFFGRLSSEKGVDLIIEALSFLKKEKKLWIVGDGPERERLEKLVSGRNLTDRVTFFGTLYGDDLERLKQRSEVVLLPSRWYENFPYVLIESLQSGCVVVASDSGGISERIHHGENGFLFKTGDVQSLVETIISLDTYILDTVRIHAMESITDLTEELFVTKLLSLYEELLSKKKILK